MHDNFILKPSIFILRDAISATNAISDGIESYPIYDYVLQSAFLKMTGAQEQKLKCVCWELASYDYTYRYERYGAGWTLGECSTYQAKKIVINDMFCQMVDKIPQNDLSLWLNGIRTTIFQRAKDEIEEAFAKAKISVSIDKDKQKYNAIIHDVKEQCLLFHITKDDSLLLFTNCTNCSNKSRCAIKEEKQSPLQYMYAKLYSYRNRCAHNLKSYQQNLPSLTSLHKDDYKFENYYLRFFLLDVIDKVIIALYQKILEVRKSVE